MTDTSTDQSTRPQPEQTLATIGTLPEPPTTVAGTLPECPSWCDRDHPDWENSFGASIIHAKAIEGEIKVRGASATEPSVVAASIEAQDWIQERKILRDEPAVRLRDSDWAFTADEARQVGRTLQEAADALDAIES